MVTPRLSALLWAAAATAAVACGDDGGGTPDGAPVDFDRRTMLSELADDVLLPTYRDFDDATVALETAIDARCDALGTPDEADAIADSRQAWRDAMTAWQRAEMMQIGPLAMNDGALRDRIYSWPVVSTCAVDIDVDLRRQDPGAYDISSRLVNRRGLDALEHVLFAATLDHTCPAQSAPEGWNELPDADRKAARCAFAADAAADLSGASTELVDAWDPAAGDYLGELTSAGDGSTTFDTAHAAVQVVSDSMFYLDTDVKDMKLAQPAGITTNSCSAVQEPCLAELESDEADFSREAIVANLEAFRMLFTGDGPEQTGGKSFDDFLRAVGATDLADTMEADIDSALETARAMPAPMEAALADDYQAVVDTHAAVKAITDNLKSQFLTVLSLELPSDAAGDTD